MTNKTHSVLYVGVTSNLEKRVYEHINGLYEKSFTSRYKVTKLVYYETTTSITIAIEREKQIKSLSRAKKEKLINDFNPEWKDLYF